MGARGRRVAIPKSQLDKQIAESTGLLAALNELDFPVLSGASGLGEEVSRALGGLIGSQYGNQYGSGGLGQRGSGFGGGGTAAGLGGLGTRGSGLGGSGYGRGIKWGDGGTASLTFKKTESIFTLGQSAPEFEFAGDTSQIQSVTNGFNKKPLAFELQDGKIVVTGLVGYSKAVIKHFQDNDALLTQERAEQKAKLDYPVIVTLSNGTKITLRARAE